jgi:hypothetical protein
MLMDKTVIVACKAHGGTSRCFKKGQQKNISKFRKILRSLTAALLAHA